MSDTGYQTQYGKADWLNYYSSELRDMHERGAAIKGDILVIPAEPHELNDAVNDRKPFMNELRYAHERIRDPGKAVEFHTLGKAIAGRTADAKTEIAFFKYYYDLTSREKGDEQGRPLGKGEIEAREEALDLTLDRMRELTPAMEQLESRVSVEAQRPGLVDSLEEVREAQASALYDDEQEHMPEPADINERWGIEESGPDIDESEAMELDAEAGSFIFNTSARDVNLNDESLRFPSGLTLEDRKAQVGIHLPNIDAKFESGMAEKMILFGIDELVEERNRYLPENLTTKQREWAWVKSQSTGAFLKAYVAQRLKDPETRALNRSEAFRLAHARINEARTPDELNCAADAIRSNNRFNERDRKLLFFGRSPDHHTPEMRELRRMWWLPQRERVAALSVGRLAPSPALKELVAELESRNSKGRVDYFFSGLKNPPEKMLKPEESVKLGLWPKSQGLLSHERAYLLDLTWEKRQSLAGRHPSLRETTSRLEESPPSRDSQSLRIYLAELKGRERSLLEARHPLSQEERTAIHDEACRQAWDRLALPESLVDDPTEAGRALSDTIAELQETTQPRARLAAQVLDEFSLQKTGQSHARIPQEALDRLSPTDLGRLKELENFAVVARDDLYHGFEKIDNLRREIELSREDKEYPGERIIAKRAENQILAQAATASRETHNVSRAAGAKDDSGQQTPPPAGRSFGEPPRESRSYREYTAAVAEIERQLLDEVIRQKEPTDKGGQEIAPTGGLLAREEKLRIRTIAAGLAWERIEPREILTNDPAVIELLSLGEAVARVRDDAQPRARAAAGNLDEFIRSRNLDRFATEKTDYYYRADQIPKVELQKLSPADKLEFAALEQHAGITFREFKEGFGAIDKIRLEIDQVRNGNGSPAAPSGAHGGEGKGQHIDRAVGRGHRAEAPDPGQERMNDRIILGNAIIAHARADAAALDYETARDHGHTFRFNIRDESVAAKRRISDLDVHRRAASRGNRAADERGAERKDDRLAIRGQISEADIHHHSTTLAEHGRKLDNLVNELESKAKDALDAYRNARHLAGVVVEKYQKRGESLPMPLVKRETLVKTQDEAIKHRFAGHTERLERLRVALAEEQGIPARSDQEAARLGAQVFTASTEVRAREERARRFDETRHLRQWEIGSEKFSLADIDYRVERLNDAAAVFGRYELHLDPGARKASSAEIERLGVIRQEVIERLNRQQGGMRERVSEAGKLLDTLTRAYGRDSALLEQSGLSMPAPLFTREEIERAADNIETARDAVGLRQLSIFERQFNTYANPKERFKPAEGWGRAPARAVVAEIFHRESNERLAAFEQRGEVQPLLIETPDGRLITHRLQDTRPQSLIEQIARPLVEAPHARELRHGVEVAFDQYENRLKAAFDQTRSYLEAAREIASAQAAERALRAGHELRAPEPALTPKQAMVIEIYAERQTDTKEREHLLSLAQGSAQSHSDSHSHSQTRSPEPVVREVASGMGRGR